MLLQDILKALRYSTSAKLVYDSFIALILLQKIVLNVLFAIIARSVAFSKLLRLCKDFISNHALQYQRIWNRNKTLKQQDQEELALSESIGLCQQESLGWLILHMEFDLLCVSKNSKWTL